MFEHYTLDSEKLDFFLFTRCRSVAELLEESYRMCFRRMLKRYDEAF